MVDGLLDKSIGIIIQARMSSERLPGKVLLPFPINGTKTILSTIYEKCVESGASVVIATSNSPESDILEQYCLEHKYLYYRGSENDVLSRFYEIQKTYNFKYIFRFTADNPFVDLNMLEFFFNRFKSEPLDYAYSTGMPLGMNFEIIKGKIIEELSALSLTNSEKEHVTLGIRNRQSFKMKAIELSNNSAIRLTIDEPSDYAQANLICQYLAGEVTLLSIIKLKECHPWMLSINSSVSQKRPA